MTITATQTAANGVANRAVGRYLDDAGSPAAATLTVGFTPRKVSWINLTDRIQYEWFEGMAADSALKTIANGTRTLETSSGITVSGGSVTIPAAIILQSKQYSWVAES